VRARAADPSGMRVRSLGSLGALSAALLVALVCGAAAAGPRASERFTPIGESPGVSGKLTTIGTIAAIERERGRIRIAGAEEGPITVAITRATKIWLDRSALGKKPATGSFPDCRVGHTVEVKYTDPGARSVAEWVKLRVPAPRAP
jgi:hypothetical protein